MSSADGEDVTQGHSSGLHSSTSKRAARGRRSSAALAEGSRPASGSIVVRTMMGKIEAVSGQSNRDSLSHWECQSQVCG